MLCMKNFIEMQCMICHTDKKSQMQIRQSSGIKSEQIKTNSNLIVPTFIYRLFLCGLGSKGM